MSQARVHYRRMRHPDGKGRIAEHRYLAAHTLGRGLEPGEVVHHRDGNPLNNTPENLVVLPSQAVHMALEWFERRSRRGVAHLFTLEVWLAVYARSRRRVRG